MMPYLPLLVFPVLGGELRLVAQGRPQAIVVTAENPLPVVAYAAEELVRHVEKATGVRLPLTTESHLPTEPPGRVYIGPTRASLALGLDPSHLPPEACILRSVEGALFIVGHDSPGDPLARDTLAGTLWGVYEFLERRLGVRWLWPGELGCFVPRRETLTAGEWNETVLPRFLQRHLRSIPRRDEPEALGFSPEAGRAYAQAEQVFLRRHRMGRSLPLRYGHAFEDWWERYGQEHPEWFQLLEDGRRGPERPGARTSMCVSNPGFHRQILELWRQARAANPGQFLNINACENDILGRCTCPHCRAWDGPPAPGLENLYPSAAQWPIVSDRYARFWLTLQQMASQEDPEVLVIGYAYVNYFPAPTTGIRLNPHILIGFCPWPGFWYPRSEAEQEFIKEQWLGWVQTGARLFLRPNYFLDGYAMPHLFPHQFAEEFQFMARHGMVGTDFDSLTAQWATQGPTLYLLARLHTRPEKPVEELLEEYYSAFGPAAQWVRAYFDYWEDYTARQREKINALVQQRGVSRYRQYARIAHEIFPPEAFAPAEALLGKAAQAAAKEPEFAARVEFLRQGLRHAQLCVRTSALTADGKASPRAVRRAWEELIAFRRATEREGIANFHWPAQVEARSWDVRRLLEGYAGEPLRPLVLQPKPFVGLPSVPLRGRHTLVALLETGEAFQARLTCRPIGNNPEPLHWRLFDPEDTLLAQGSLEPNRSEEVRVPGKQAGVYLLVVDPGRNAAQVTLLNDHAALAGRTLSLVHQTAPLFFFVPPGVRRFTLTVQSPAPGETVRVRLFDSLGKEVAVGETGPVAERRIEVKVPPGQDGRPWSVRVERGETGVLEDYTLILDSALPGFWALAEDRLVVPQAEGGGR